jgi:hypothetical protein
MVHSSVNKIKAERKWREKRIVMQSEENKINAEKKFNEKE